MKATLRRWWRQLTSMRTALVLLLFLAIAAVPGSLLPQRRLNIEQVRQYFAANPELAPTLDKLWLFDVYAAPWFAAIYLLLFTSLIGCLIPRLRTHLTALRTPPPDAPARMTMLPQHRALDTTTTVDAAKAGLRKAGYRVAVHETNGRATVAGEKGYAREAGNLLFHFSMMLLLVGVAYGSIFGWHGNRILVAGEDAAFCNSLQQYDEYGLGAGIDATSLPPFCLQLNDFEAKFAEDGQPTTFLADVLYSEDGSAPSEQYDLRVNHPLDLDGASVFLLGHGYAPVISYTDRYGVTQTSTTAFLPEDMSLVSNGAAVFPDANIDPETGERDPDSQVAFEGLFIPNAPEQPPYTTSISPAADNPRLLLIAYRGDTGLDDGQPRSVYSVDVNQIESGELEIVETEQKFLAPGESVELDDGSYVTFEGFKPYATLQVREDPGELLVLVAAILMLGGLMPGLIVKRRRVWVRVGDEGTEVGGLTRNEYEGFAEEFDRLADEINEAGTARDTIGSKA
ncbi:cytochrome c biogenesis protein ResB [Stackebrandtia soli]|uniref:cytochrome c biogenesis protein ResB n=1 Tax=Stackebrandtia soli TaxID=1892856 RepID=UPI0039E9C3F5